MFLSASLQLSYFGLRSFDPSVPLQRPGLTVSLPSNTTHYTFSQLHPGVTYQLTIRASTSKGFGLAATLNVTTNISGRGGFSVFHTSSDNGTIFKQPVDLRATPLFSPDNRWVRRVWGVSEWNCNNHYDPTQTCSGQGSTYKVYIIIDVCHTQGLVVTQLEIPALSLYLCFFLFIVRTRLWWRKWILRGRVARLLLIVLRWLFFTFNKTNI